MYTLDVPLNLYPSTEQGCRKIEDVMSFDKCHVGPGVSFWQFYYGHPTYSRFALSLKRLVNLICRIDKVYWIVG